MSNVRKAARERRWFWNIPFSDSAPVPAKAKTSVSRNKDKAERKDRKKKKKKRSPPRRDSGKKVSAIFHTPLATSVLKPEDLPSDCAFRYVVTDGFYKHDLVRLTGNRVARAG